MQQRLIFQLLAFHLSFNPLSFLLFWRRHYFEFSFRPLNLLLLVELGPLALVAPRLARRGLAQASFRLLEGAL